MNYLIGLIGLTLGLILGSGIVFLNLAPTMSTMREEAVDERATATYWRSVALSDNPAAVFSNGDADAWKIEALRCQTLVAEVRLELHEAKVKADKRRHTNHVEPFANCYICQNG